MTTKLTNQQIIEKVLKDFSENERGIKDKYLLCRMGFSYDDINNIIQKALTLAEVHSVPLHSLPQMKENHKPEDNKSKELSSKLLLCDTSGSSSEVIPLDKKIFKGYDLFEKGAELLSVKDVKQSLAGFSNDKELRFSAYFETGQYNKIRELLTKYFGRGLLI